MKKFAFALALVLVAAFALSAAAQDKFPSLKGNWSGSAHLHRKNLGFIKDRTVALIILEQDGPLFHGEKIWTDKATGKQVTETFSGIIAPDGSVYTAEEIKGMNFGTYENGVLTFYHLEDGPGQRASVQVFKKK